MTSAVETPMYIRTSGSDLLATLCFVESRNVLRQSLMNFVEGNELGTWLRFFRKRRLEALPAHHDQPAPMLFPRTNPVALNTTTSSATKSVRRNMSSFYVRSGPTDSARRSLERGQSFWNVVEALLVDGENRHLRPTVFLRIVEGADFDENRAGQGRPGHRIVEVTA